MDKTWFVPVAVAVIGGIAAAYAARKSKALSPEERRRIVVDVQRMVEDSLRRDYERVTMERDNALESVDNLRVEVDDLRVEVAALRHWAERLADQVRSVGLVPVAFNHRKDEADV